MRDRVRVAWGVNARVSMSDGFLPREGLVLLILLLQEWSLLCLVLRLAMGSRAVCCGEDANWGDWEGDTPMQAVWTWWT